MISENKELFKIKDFSFWLASRLFANFAKQMALLVVSWQVYEISKSALALGVVGLSQAVPYLTVALWSGHVVDRHEKKKIILWALLGLVVCGGALTYFSSGGHPPVWIIYVILGALGFLSSFELTGIGAYVQMVVPNRIFPKAVAWNLSLFQFATVMGPITGGWLIELKGAAFAYKVVTLLFLLSVLFASFLRPIEPDHENTHADGLKNIKEGVKFVMSRRIILGCMALDMMAVFFGDAIAILPIFADLLNAGPVGLGILRASPAVGSFIASTIEANRTFIKVNWTNFLRTVSVFGICMIGFALSQNFLLSAFFLMVSGMADGIGVIIRQSVYQANTPNHLRGRVASISGIFIRISNEMGGFESGVAATVLGVIPSVIFGGVMTLVSVGFMRLKYPRLK